MAYYSFVADAPCPVGIPKPFVMLDEGRNTFTAEVEDLEGFLSRLHDEGVTVVSVNKLDDFEENTPQDLLLPGESLNPFLLKR